MEIGKTLKFEYSEYQLKLFSLMDQKYGHSSPLTMDGIQETWTLIKRIHGWYTIFLRMILNMICKDKVRNKIVY